MSERERLSVEELKKVGWRIKSVRSLTGLNQEEFALKSDIAPMTLRGWEFGRSLPRPDGINRILSGLLFFGVQVRPEWIIFGEGSGPVLSNNSHTDKYETDLGLEGTIEAFKKEQRKKSNNPVVIKIHDKSMSPLFNPGDIVGGIILNISDIKNKYSSCEFNSRKWLIPSQDNEWIVREIIFNGEKTYYKSLNSADIVEINTVSIAKIVWHYFDGEHK
jgi:transcriptional regulator with XRE-family HTH domain